MYSREDEAYIVGRDLPLDSVIRDIASSLGRIADMLAEMNGYIVARNSDTQQTDDACLRELMDAVERGEMSDATANQAWYEYINNKVEESDTPQTDYPCNTCANKGDHDGECKNCVADSAPIRWKTPSHYKPQRSAGGSESQNNQRSVE